MSSDQHSPGHAANGSVGRGASPDVDSAASRPGPPSLGDGRKSSLHAIISGRVQGVGFRYSAQMEARRRGLSGWVKNLADGRVETRACGNDGALRAYLQWLGSGPPAAAVSGVQLLYFGPARSEDKTLPDKFQVTR